MTESRAELLNLLGEISEAGPDLRPGRTIANLAKMARGPQPEAIWDCEDGEFAAVARRLLLRLRERIFG